MIRQEIQSLEPDAAVDLFILDLNPMGVPSAFRFYAGKDTNYGDLVYQGQTYTAKGIEVTGYEKKGTGPQTRPILSIGNASGYMSGFVAPYNDLIGASLTRLRTFAKYLDAGANPDTSAFTTELHYIERKKLENKEVIQFELATPMDFMDKQLPGRMLVANTCAWIYKSGECSWPGTNPALYFERDGTPTVDPQQDDCGKRLGDCEARFGAGQELPYGGVPTVGRI